MDHYGSTLMKICINKFEYFVVNFLNPSSQHLNIIIFPPFPSFCFSCSFSYSFSTAEWWVWLYILRYDVHTVRFPLPLLCGLGKLGAASGVTKPITLSSRFPTSHTGMKENVRAKVTQKMKANRAW
jgi:hypothetical protein